LPIVRALPRSLRGRWRVARWLLGRELLDRRDCVVDTGSGMLFLVPSLREPVAFGLLVDGDYEPATWQAIAAYLPRNGTFIDVGANLGLFSVKAAAHLRDGGRLLAIEASPSMHRYLEENLRLAECRNVTVSKLAITGGDGSDVSFYEAPREKFGMGSLAPQFESSAVQVPGRTLDSLCGELAFDRVDVIKIDVEGFEAEVFVGASRLLSSPDKPVIVFEFLDWAERRSGREPGFAQSLLLDYGYRLHVIEESGKPSPPLAAPVVAGGAMLLAVPAGRPSNRS
jgi:FkbM family methyltransferase